MNSPDRIASSIGVTGLYIFVVSMPYSPALSETGFAISLLAALFLAVSNRHISLPSRTYNIALAVFLILVISTIPFSMDPELSIRKFGIVRWLFFPYIILNLNPDIKTSGNLIKTLMVASGIFSVYLLVQHFSGKPVIPYKFDVYQTVNPGNTEESARIALRFGQYYAMLAVFAVVLIIYANRQLKLIMVSVLSGVLSAASTYFAYARSGAVGMWVSLTTWGLLRARTVFYSMLAVTLISIFLVFLFPKTEFSELFYSTIHPTAASGARYGSNMARIHMFDNTLKIVRQHPFTGAGFNCYGEWTRIYEPADAGWERTFSDPAEFLATTGVTGFLGFLILYVSIFSVLFKCSGALSDAVLAAFLVFAAGGVFEPMFFNTVLLRGIMFLIGLCMLYNKNEGTRV